MSGTGRPTYRTRKGRDNPGAEYINTRHVMVRDLPSHTQIKLRAKKVINKDELLKRLQKLDGPKINFDDDNNADGKYSNIHDFDGDDEDDSDSSSIDTDTGDEDDEQAALLNELERMKREKAEEEERKIREAQDQIRNQFTTNPLLDPDYSTKRQWTEEAIFHNQALITHQKKADRYVNDPIRSEYHQKFMQKYLRM